MLTIFDGNNGYPISQDDYYIRELASGYNEVIFNVNIRDSIYQYVKEEARIRDRNQNEYLIKQVDAGNDTAKVVAQINLDEWKSQLYMDYSNNSNTVAGTVAGIAPTGWAVIDQSGITKRRTIPTSDTTRDYNVTALEILSDCVSVYEVRFKFDTNLKRIYIINPASYSSRGAFATRDLNLRALNYKGKSEGLVTRLYAEGADGLTFADINDGKSYVENRTYVDKIICSFWKDDRYTDKQSLLDDAQAKVDSMSRPTQSYDCDVIDLANTNPEVYGFEDFSLFEIVTLIDDAKRTRTDYQVVERWTYPYYPVKNKVVLSTSTPNIQSAIQTVVASLTQSTSNFQQMIDSAIENATALITGNSGGYLVLHDSNGDGTPDELLIMNTPDIETATKVWRWNQAGLGYSDTGYEGTYELGITMDGSIVASMITSGVMDANLIRAGAIQDLLGNNYWNLETGEFRLSAQTQVGNSTIASESDISSAVESANKHSYLDSNIFTDISLWEYGAVAPTFETIEGKTYLVIDGTGISAFNSNYYVRTLMNIVGDIHINAKFIYHIDTQVTIAQQRFPFINFSNSSGGMTSWWNLGAQTIPANTDFTWNLRNNQTDVDANKPAYFGFYAIPGCKTYIEFLEVYSTVDVFASSGIDFTNKGLNLFVAEVGVHNYLPYDLMTNINRWVSDTSAGYVTTLEQHTFDGVTKDCLVIDGTNANPNYHFDIVKANTDLIGKCTCTLKYKYRVSNDITFSSAQTIGYVNVKTDSGYYTPFVNTLSSGTTLRANVEYTYERTATLSYSANYFEEKSRVVLFGFEGISIYFYDIEFTGDEGNYKKASLSYTADGLNSVVQSGSIISTINQSAEAVTIEASKIDLTGDVNLRGEFTSYATYQQLSGYYAQLDGAGITIYDPQGNSVGGLVPTFSTSGVEVSLTLHDWSTNTFVSISPRTRSILKDLYVNGGFEIDYNAGEYALIRIPTQFFSTVYNSSGSAVFVSDRRKKRNIKDLVIKKAKSFIMSLKPRQFKFTKDISTSNRLHHGFIAQEVKEAMTEDWGLYVEDKEQDFIGLRYDEIIADLVAVVQDQEKRIESLERRLDDLTNNQH